MKIKNLNKKKISFIIIMVIFLLTLVKITISYGMQNYYNVGFTTGLVTATNLNVRSGPGSQYKIIATVKKNEYIRVFAGVGDWYIVQVEGDYVGAVNKKYVKAIYPSVSNKGSTTSNRKHKCRNI